MPQRILDGQDAIGPVINSGLNALNFGIALVVNYGLDQLQFFTGIFIVRLPVPLVPFAVSAVTPEPEQALQPLAMRAEAPEPSGTEPDDHGPEGEHSPSDDSAS